MDIAKYSVFTDRSHEVYEFLSQGPRAAIKKVVYYQEIDDGLFNIAFGDWDEARQRINDSARSNNDDRDRVLATVAFTAIDFIKFHPSAIIFAKGNTPARTRLYQIGITKNWTLISEMFDIEGFADRKWEAFKPGKITRHLS
jgi:hypothetical protein